MAVAEVFGERGEVLGGIRRLDGDLDQVIGVGAVDRDAGAVGAAVGHGDEHVRQERTELRFQRFVLEKKPDDAAHFLIPFRMP